MRARIGALVAGAVLLAIAWLAPHVRRRLIADAITWDAPPSDPAQLPVGDGPGLPRIAQTRVMLIDGLAADTAATMPELARLCKTGTTLTIDVGFPTISLPVEVALWSGLTQQQTGIMFRSDRPLDPPLRGIPSQVAGSFAIAESHGYIVRSLGFSRALPAADASDPAKDEAGWTERWRTEATSAVESTAPLVFVHVLRVDTAGHKFGHDSAEYREAAHQANEMLAILAERAPRARWFVLSDHGHLPQGGHGGEERIVRQVEGCMFGPDVPRAEGVLVHVVDVARAIADSVGAKLDASSRGRPISVALLLPLGADQAIPRLALGAGAIAILMLFAGLAGASWGVRRWWLAPWWFVVAIAALVLVRGEPTLSMPMVFKPEGRTMYVTWLAALPLAALATWFGLRTTTLARVLAAQLALPFAAVAAAFTVCGAWPALLGAEVAPVVPRFTAWMSPLILMAAHGAAAVALGVLGTTVRSAFGRPSPPETPRSAPADG